MLLKGYHLSNLSITLIERNLSHKILNVSNKSSKFNLSKYKDKFNNTNENTSFLDSERSKELFDFTIMFILPLKTLYCIVESLLDRIFVQVFF